VKVHPLVGQPGHPRQSLVQAMDGAHFGRARKLDNSDTPFSNFSFISNSHVIFHHFGDTTMTENYHRIIEV
jgi:hypothetical protein